MLKGGVTSMLATGVLIVRLHFHYYLNFLFSISFSFRTTQYYVPKLIIMFYSIILLNAKHLWFGWTEEPIGFHGLIAIAKYSQPACKLDWIPRCYISQETPPNCTKHAKSVFIWIKFVPIIYYSPNIFISDVIIWVNHIIYTSLGLITGDAMRNGYVISHPKTKKDSHIPCSPQ